MNKNNLKSFAPQARKDFIAAVTVRAQQLGFSATGIEDATLSGDVLIINGVGWPARVSGQREKLKEKISQHGFAQTMEEVAYTWFNRFAALRYMELHDFLDHGHRVLSSRDDGLPELLRHASEVTLPGLNAAKVTEMQLAGNRDNELYKLLLVAQCNELSRSMPFLFERIDDETELLLPDNLLRTDSIIAKLVAGVPEDDWQEIEVIGWLYQFYISEKKDQVIGKVVKSEDIPAATQLFTPNWIVQYLVQNSVGRLWLMANPQSTLAQAWPYYIAPAEQTPEVQAQLDALIQTRVREDGDTLNPESITVLDPACGSGHILVVAYDVLKAIYQERGYQPRSIPRLILEKNLYGLDIDDRAAQMAGFALLMKARADDRRLFNEPIQLNVLSLQESKGLDAATLANALYPDATQAIKPLQVAGFEEDDLFPTTRVQMRLGEGQEPQTNNAARHATAEVQTIQQLIDTFAHAKTFGSLMQIGLKPRQNMHEMLLIVEQAKKTGDLYAKAAAQDLLPLLQQAQVLAMQFDAVVANPPYMGGKGMNPSLKEYAKATFPDSKSDLFAMFMERGFELCKASGFNSMVTMQGWMFLSSFEVMRKKIIQNRVVSSLVQIGYNRFPEMNSKIAQACAFSIGVSHVNGYCGLYLNLNSSNQSADKASGFLNRDSSICFSQTQDEFKKIPGFPLAYWINESVRTIFESSVFIGDVASPRAGLATGDNSIFQKQWHEVSLGRIGFGFETTKDAAQSGFKWFPCNSGGPFRKWYGNHEMIVNWENDGELIRGFKNDAGKIKSRPQNTQFFFKPGVTWTKLSTGTFAARFREVGFVFDDTGRSAFSERDEQIISLLAMLCSNSAGYFLSLLNASLSFTSGDIARIPIPKYLDALPSEYAKEAVEISKQDWDSSEESWNFSKNVLVLRASSVYSIGESWRSWDKHSADSVNRLRHLEVQNNSIFINAYGLQDELSPEVPESQITLARADREKDCQRLISYAIGCMMGRYSLDEPGLIYAHAGNVGFEPGRYATFPADADGIVPITDELWFDDDAANRIREFLLAVWGQEKLEENMAWLGESLGGQPVIDWKSYFSAPFADETIRTYLAKKFYKDHLKNYKKRPIYWLFSSGKQGAFQALVYLHRYNESTLARMRAEYVIPLTAKMASRLEMLEQDANAAASAAARTKIRKQIETLRKKQTELLTFDETLRHFADMRITLDLDDGVKVNYGKFGDLLEGVKMVTGGGADD